MVKTNFSVEEMTGNTNGEVLLAAVLEALDQVFIPRTNVVSISTDGCSTMLGTENGVHALMRKVLPHIPDWGGCIV